MLLSINWLRDYLQKTDVKIDPKGLADRLTMRGLQVLSIKRAGMGLTNVMVGRIEKIEKHPNADRLQVTQVVTSPVENAPRLQIVCGAKNISEGDIVAVALPGAILPGEVTIKTSKIREVESHGMICSGKELGLSDDSEGILQLPKQTLIGQPIGRLFGQDDTILEFELTPNRSDCLSLIGLAREIAPVLETKYREPKEVKFRITPHRTSSIVKVEVDDPVACPRYVARVIDGLKVADSPDWIKQRLQSVGIRPVNNIVDITNFVMLEYGQPLHAFDLRRIESGTIRVKTCQEPRDFALLSGQVVQLVAGDILIQDGDRPIALAGIMGGANSQIQPDTTSILLESAVFLPQQIRKTAKRLGFITESSRRFEKGVDPLIAALASERAASLLRDGFNANVYHPPIDTNETLPTDRTLSLDMRDVKKITGISNLTSEKAADLLESIGISSHKKSANILIVKIPSFRLDITESIDIIEEVSRLIGYDAIPEHYPLSNSSYERPIDSTFEFELRAKQVFQILGLRETIHYSFVSEELLQRFGASTDALVRIKNPISEEMKVMRTSLLPSLMGTYIHNRNRRNVNQRFFELSRVFQEDISEETKVRETTTLSGIISGSTLPVHWKGTSEPVDFFYAKGIIEAQLRNLTTVSLGYESLKNHRLFHPHRSAILKLGLKEIGFVGEVHPVIRSAVLESDETLVAFELNLDALRKYERTTPRFKTPSKYPAVNVDLALIVDRGISSHSLVENIRHSGGGILTNVEIFDVYEGKNIPEGSKSIAFHLNFVSHERTLVDEDVKGVRDRIIQNLASKFGASLRA